jgi:hypothetical protein
MLFGRKKTQKVSVASEAGKPVEFYFDRKDVRRRMRKIRIPTEILIKPSEIDDVEAMKMVIALQGILRYVDRTFEAPGTFNVHKESIASDLKEVERKLSALEKDKPGKAMRFADTDYRVYPTLEAIKRYMEQPWKYHK